MYNLIGVKLFSKILYLFHQTTHNSIATNKPIVGNTAISLEENFERYDDFPS